MATVYTQSGEEKITDFTTGADSAPANYYIAWGTDGTTASKSDTSLFNEAAESRATATVTQSATDTAQFKGTLTSASNQSISEVGLFDAASSGSMYIRQDHAAENIQTDDSIEYTITLEQT